MWFLLPNVGTARLLYETLRVAYFHVRVRTSVFVGAASPSGEG
ncbi:MAG: hypothetical protein V7K48_33310 [Nostoc sp.]